MKKVREAVEAGSMRERKLAAATMDMVRDALDLNYLGKH